MSIKEEIKNLKEAWDELAEDIHSQINKTYPKNSEENKRLHRAADETQERVKQADMERDLGKHEFKPTKDLFSIDFDPEDEKRIEKETEWETKRYFKPMSKNEKGEHNTLINQFGTSNKEDIDKLKPARKALGKRKAKMNKRMNDNNSLQEQIDSLIESYTALLEAGVETESTGNEKEISPNKIRKTKKDKNGNKVEVLSVEDELFPNEGNAKQQYNQKIINKINDMIEGTATLQDLLNLVRQKKVAPVK